ncbi:MAG: lysoplasmalogenase [Cyclobacteriaceae bacterium]|nr:lysoplasmalogenase [Cyclobacteriaceae bacterium]
MKSKILVLFFIVSLGELIAVAIDKEVLQWVFKPLIMVVLGGVYFSGTSESAPLAKAVVGAIVFSWIGDVCLMFQGESEMYFMAGLGAFFIAHLCYVMAYYQHTQKKEGAGLFGIQKFRFSLPIVLAGTGLITILYTHLGALKVPVIFYAILLMVMTLQALFRYGYTNAISFWFVFVGALLFMISDSLIAVNKFLSSFELAGIAIMATYLLAQFLIIRGLRLHFKK